MRDRKITQFHDFLGMENSSFSKMIKNLEHKNAMKLFKGKCYILRILQINCFPIHQ